VWEVSTTDVCQTVVPQNILVQLFQLQLNGVLVPDNQCGVVFYSLST
jgi:hypothetical protein